MEKKKSIILIVDDNQENVRVLAESIKIPDVEIAVALSGKDALEYIQEEIPDLILLDIMMPEMDGFEVCQIIKADVRTAEIPVIFLSALNSPESIVKGLELGGADYLLKPFNILEINARLKTHLKIRKAHEYAINLLRDFAGSIPDINLILDENGVIVEVFSLHEAMLEKIGDENIIGEKMDRLLPGAENIGFYGRFREVLSENKHVIFKEEINLSGVMYIFQFIVAPMVNMINDKRMMSFHALDVTQSSDNERQVSMMREYNRKNLFFNSLLSGAYDSDEQNKLLKSYQINPGKRYVCCEFAYKAEDGKDYHVDITNWLAGNLYSCAWDGQMGTVVLAEIEESVSVVEEISYLRDELQSAFAGVDFKFGAVESQKDCFDLSLLCTWANVALKNAVRSQQQIFIANTDNQVKN